MLSTDGEHRQAVEDGARQRLLVVGAVQALTAEVLLLGIAQGITQRHCAVELAGEQCHQALLQPDADLVAVAVAGRGDVRGASGGQGRREVE